MIFCSHCFRDSEIVGLINQSPTIGTCPICGRHGVHLYNTDSQHLLDGIFDDLLDAYTPVENLPENFPDDDLATLGSTMLRDWNIFEDIGEDKIVSIIEALSRNVVGAIPTLFSGPIGIAEKYNDSFLKEHSILWTKSWEEFVEIIKHKNRFHTNVVNTELLRQYCFALSKEIKVDQKFYRGRIAGNKEGHTKDGIGAPPPTKASDGRANPKGISRLYLTYDQDTTLHEIRAAEFDYVTIGTFKAKVPLRLVDLKRINSISPFLPDIDCAALAINREHLEKIGFEISKTMRRGDSPLDYVPTQYIADFIMSIEDEEGNPVFDGVEYQSAMKSGGANLAVFYPEKFNCVYRRTYEVKKLIYEKDLPTK